ncbi:hypothetical protein DOY81_011825 [Sarcophaga bullata]|nr:hypothetical protein DOY81_011825 [Sarcophaga bullata]
MDTYHNKYREKSENTDVKHLKADRSWQPCFVVYDLLYWNGESMMQVAFHTKNIQIEKLN